MSMGRRLYDFEVLDADGRPTGEVIEELVQADTTMIESPTGVKARRKKVQLWANTPTRWGDSHTRYEAALGCTVRNARDIDRICDKKGLTPVADLAKGTAERLLQRQIDHHAHYQKVDARWDELVKKHKMYDEKGEVDHAAAARVWEEHCPAYEVRHGTWDGAKEFKEF